MDQATTRSAAAEQNADRLIRRHARAVLAYCLRRASHDDAHDAAAETFSVAWRRLDQVPEGEDALPWLLGVARNVLANQDRGRRRRLRLRARLSGLATNPDPSPEAVTVRHARQQEVVDALHLIPKADGELLTMIVWDELPREQVAASLGISLDAVHKRYQRALHRFERAFRPSVNPATHHEGESL